jgi:branched-chain amino acid transport system substrate-binding protein
MRKRFVVVQVLALVALFTLACRGGAPAAQPAAGQGGGSATAAPIKIGAILSTTGLLAPFGTDAQPAAELFAEELNARGGINGRPLQIVYVDDESKPDQAVSAAKRLIQQEKVVTILGPVSAVVSASVAPVLNESKVPAVLCQCVTGPMTPYEFSVFPIAGMMESQAEFARSHGVSRIGVISQAGSLAEVIKNTQVPILEREGMTIVGFEQFQATDTDLTPLLARLRSNGAQQLFVAASGTPAATAAKNFKQLNYPGYYWTFAGNANEAFLKLVSEAAEVVNLAGTKVLVYKELPDSDALKPRLAEFAAKYSAKTGREPGTYAALAYDSLLSIAEAIGRAGDNPEKIRDALETQTGLQTLTGTVNRSAQEHNGLVPEWLTVRIDPAAQKFAVAK